MPKTLQQWKVLPHGKLTQVDDNILTVVGELHMPLTDLPRRMTVVRLNDGRLVIDQVRELVGWSTSPSGRARRCATSPPRTWRKCATSS